MRGAAGAGAALAVLLAAAGLSLLAPGSQQPDPAPPASGRVPVTSAVLGCPQLTAVPPRLTSSFTLGSAAGDLGGTGAVTGAPGSSPARGETAEVAADSEEGLAVTAEGELAQGLFGWRADSGPGRVAVVPCGAPRASWWFPGAGATVDHTSVLTLANLDQTPAVVDIRALSIDGPLDAGAAGGTGLTLAPGERTELPLADLLPSTDEVTLQVEADRGRVVAAVLDTVTEPDGVGVEWLPSLEEPARDLRLAGVPGRAVSRTLLVSNPTERATLVRIEIAGSSGRLVPAGVEEVSVEAGSIATVDLTDAVRGEPYAVRLRSQRPVVATLRSLTAGPEVGYAAPVTVLDGAGVVPVVGATQLQLAAGGQITRATARAVSASGEEVGSFRFSLGASSSATWRVPRRAAYVVVEPTQGRAYGAAVYAGRSGHPVVELSVDVRVPSVRPGG